MKYEKSTIILLALYIILSIVAMTGYIKCIVKFCQCDFKESYKAEIIYGVGTATGAGVVLGYIDFGK